MSGEFKDHFSAHAADYAAYRPVYPGALFDWLADAAPARRLAWDCATGNGQAALQLARRFERVIASDASEQQLRHARQAGNIEYRVAAAENSGLEHRSVDLVTVAQSYHWFDHAAFVAECGRVCVPRGLLAIWCYALVRVTPEVDAVVATLYRGDVGPYWPPERRLVESGYRGLAFPWPELGAPRFVMALKWTLPQFEGYLRTWSAVRRCIEAEGADPVGRLHQRLQKAWRVEPGQPLRVEWPIMLRAFRMH